MNLITEPNYDKITIIVSMFLLAVTYVVFGHAPRRYYAALRDKTWISKTELQRLYREIDVLNAQIQMLQSAPIKKETQTGQLRFDVPEEKAQVKKLPHDRLVTYSPDKKIVDVYVKVRGGFAQKYSLPVGTAVSIVKKEGQFGLLNKSLFVDGRPDLPDLYLHENDVQVQQGYDVWSINDWQRYQDGKRLVKRGRSRMWVNDEEVQKNDVVLDAFKWEAV